MADEKSGWGVVRLVPWHLLGIFNTSAEAHVRCLEAGRNFEVHFGKAGGNADVFTWHDPKDPIP